MRSVEKGADGNTLRW